jgi:hypothetical protein
MRYTSALFVMAISLNGQKVAEMDECTWWTPFNNVVKVKLNKGPNQLLVKLLRRGEDVRFTLGFREDGRKHHPGNFNCQDWLVDLSDKARWRSDRPSSHTKSGHQNPLSRLELHKAFQDLG